jgi:hypothetical protein
MRPLCELQGPAPVSEHRVANAYVLAVRGPRDLDRPRVPMAAVLRQTAGSPRHPSIGRWVVR